MKKKSEYQQARRKKHRFILIAEWGGKCFTCESLDELEFDHIDPRTKLFDIGKCFHYSLENLRAEAKKCQLLCNPCHREKTLANGEYNWRSRGKTYTEHSVI